MAPGGGLQSSSQGVELASILSREMASRRPFPSSSSCAIRSQRQRISKAAWDSSDTSVATGERSMFIQGAGAKARQADGLGNMLGSTFLDHPALMALVFKASTMRFGIRRVFHQDKGMLTAGHFSLPFPGVPLFHLGFHGCSASGRCVCGALLRAALRGFRQ